MYTLQPILAKNLSLLEDPDKPAFTVSYKELCTRLAPPPNISKNQQLLREVKEGNFVGLRRTRGQLIMFVVELEPDEGARLDWLLESDPSFFKEVELVYRIKAVSRAGGITVKKKKAPLT